MKRLILAILFLFCVTTIFSQNFPIDSTTKLISYSEIINVKSGLRKDLFFKANQWMAKTYKSSSAIWKVQDAENGKILVKARMNTEVTYLVGKIEAGYVYYTVEIVCKDNRYMYVFTDFYHDGHDTENRTGGALENSITKQNYLSMPVHWEEIRTQVDQNIRLLISDLTKYMNSPQNDKW